MMAENSPNLVRYKLTDSRICANPKYGKLKEILIITKLLKTKEKN